DDLAAAVAALGAEVDHPVRRLDHFEIVLDHHHGVAGVGELVQHLQELGDVVKVQARGWLVEDIQRAAGGALTQLLGELDALRLAAGERRRLLADMDVVEADAVQERQHVAHARHRLEELERLFHRHVEHVGDRLALEQYLERLAVVALALADVASDVDVGQEVHLDLDDAVALAGLAAAALDVEREAARLVAARLALGQGGEPFADRREGAGIGRRVGPRRAADRRLVDVDDLVDMLQAFDAVVRSRGQRGAVELARDRVVQRVDQERRLAAAGDAGDAGEQAERDLGGDVLEIVAAGVDDLELAVRIGPAALGDRHAELAGEIFAGP